MKKINITYWIFNGLFALLMLGSAIPDILVDKAAVEGFKQMGLTAALVPFLGVAKALGVIAILVPGYARIKEWAYAGLTFDLIGATYLLASIGFPLIQLWFMYVALGLAAAAYITYHRRLKAKSAGKIVTTNQAADNRIVTARVA